MKDLRRVRKMFGIRVQDGRELAMVFQQGQPFLANPIDNRSRAKYTLTDGEVTGPDESSSAPVEAAPTMIKASICHELKQLVMTYEARIANLPQQTHAAFGPATDPVLCVAHNRSYPVESFLFE